MNFQRIHPLFKTPPVTFDFKKYPLETRKFDKGIIVTAHRFGADACKDLPVYRAAVMKNGTHIEKGGWVSEDGTVLILVLQSVIDEVKDYDTVMFGWMSSGLYRPFHIAPSITTDENSAFACAMTLVGSAMVLGYEDTKDAPDKELADLLAKIPTNEPNFYARVSEAVSDFMRKRLDQERNKN